MPMTKIGAELLWKSAPFLAENRLWVALGVLLEKDTPKALSPWWEIPIEIRENHILSVNSYCFEWTHHPDRKDPHRLIDLYTLYAARNVIFGYESKHRRVYKKDTVKLTVEKGPLYTIC